MGFDGRSSEDGALFSVSEESSGRLECRVCDLGLFRRAQTDSISIVAPEALGSVGSLHSSLKIL